MPNRISELLLNGLSCGSIGQVMRMNAILQEEFPRRAQIVPVNWFTPSTMRTVLFWADQWPRHEFISVCEAIWGSVGIASINNNEYRIIGTVPDVYDRMWIMGIPARMYVQLHAIDAVTRYLHGIANVGESSPDPTLTMFVADRITRAVRNPNYRWNAISQNYSNVRQMERDFYSYSRSEAYYDVTTNSEQSFETKTAIEELVKDLANTYSDDIDIKNLHKLVINAD